MALAEDKLRLFNVRYVPLFALFLILGIFCVKVSLVVAIILWVVAAFCAAALLLTKQIKWGVAIALVCFMFVGFGAASLDLYVRNNVGLRGQGVVTCRVTEVISHDGYYEVVADSVSAGGKSFSGGITFSAFKKLASGDRVTFYGKVNIDELSLEDAESALLYRRGSKYKADVSAITDVESGSPPLADRIKAGAEEILVKYQGERMGAFSYATIFGDTDDMEKEDKTAMRSVGVAHVFAISGLHVAVLAGALLFVLRKFKVKDGVSFLILLPIFGFYAYLVGFSPSVLRAAIMVSLSLAASHFGMRYDDLSALGFAAILILLTRPLILFDISFIMSFLSIFGIHSLASPLKKAFLRHKMKEKLAGALALSISSTVALLPVSAVVFGRITFVGVLLNLIVVPLASVSYILSLIGLLLTAITPAFGAFLSAVYYLPFMIAELSVLTASLDLAEKYKFMTGEIIVYYMTLAFVGKYCLASKKVKLVAGGMGAGILAILIFAV